MEEQKQPQKRQTFGTYITIPGPVFYNRAISGKAKLLYGLLSAMSQAPKYYAYAYNETMTAYLQCSERSLQRYLGELVDAGEIRIEDGQGGRKTLRKIYLVRVQPFNPDKNVGVNPDKNDGVNIYSINKQKKEKGKDAAAVSQAEIISWFDHWATSEDWSGDDQTLEAITKLLGDIHGFVEARAAKGKPLLTIRSAAMAKNRLMGYSEGYSPRIPAMRYMLQESISHNWEKIFPIKESQQDDYLDFLRREYNVAPPVQEEVSGWD